MSGNEMVYAKAAIEALLDDYSTAREVVDSINKLTGERTISDVSALNYQERQKLAGEIGIRGIEQEISAKDREAIHEIAQRFANAENEPVYQVSPSSQVETGISR
ncbi:MAG: hypothetical protein COV36_03670 [Alphaproteobacteria bacterium CG11_big_fil_rev_8_21_14_0_20_44_7]|nr:MAG: hypothetical protein COV36_03670 [Alphaproteobacteria bacterium CG11_big_fil_rev_8_21_14_0_20_44_7]